MPSNPQTTADVARFTTTHWSVVLAATQKEEPEATLALNELRRACRLPLYAFLRRPGETPHDAEDLTQAFFTRLLERAGTSLHSM